MDNKKKIKKILLNIIIALNIAQLGIPAYKAINLFLNEKKFTSEEEIDTILEILINTGIDGITVITTACIACELEEIEEVEEEEKKLVK